MNNLKSLSILFLSENNAVRSQFAEALLRYKTKGAFHVLSAGLYLTDIADVTNKVMHAHGLETQQLSTNCSESLLGQHFDYVINLSIKHDQSFRTKFNYTHFLSWDIQATSTSDNEQLHRTLLALSSRIDMLLSLLSPSLIQSSNNFDSIAFYKSMAEPIRLNTLMLTHFHGELCVCELMQALQEESQPKVSRNLAVLKKAGVLSTNKIGQWVYYRINPSLPAWAKTVIAQTTEQNINMIIKPIQSLTTMKNRPNKNTLC